MSNTEANQQTDTETLVHKFLSQLSESETKEMAGLLGVKEPTPNDLSFNSFIEDEPLNTALHTELKDQPHYTPETLDHVLEEVQKWISDSTS